MRSIILLTMVSLALVLSSCGKRETPSKISAPTGRGRIDNLTGNGPGGTGGGNANPQTTKDSFTTYAGGWGEIGTNASDDLAYNEQLKALVSASMDPNSLGHVSPISGQQTWVRFKVQIKLNSDFTVDSSNSFIQIAIKDEYATQAENLVSIAIEGGARGQLNGDSLVVAFEDKYGQIILDGKVNQAYNGSEYFVGSISFQNKTHFIQGQAPRSGVIGGFAITENNSITK